MKNRQRLVGCVALALAGILVSADIGLSQCWGNGPRWREQFSPTGWQGRGPGKANCPNYGDYRYCVQNQGNYSKQGPKGSRRGVRNISPNSQTTNPLITNNQ